MTIAEYLENPYGKGSAFGYNKQLVLNLDKEFETLKEKISYKIYRFRDNVIYHVVIPSTKKEEVTYDVIIEVQTSRLHEGAGVLDNLDFKCFSNCPSFIFTYANVFRRYRMLCEWLVEKYSEEVRKNAPSVRNRFNVIGVERSLYLAMKFIHFKGLTRITTYLNTGVKLSNRNEVIKNVRTQEEIMEKVRAKVKPTEEPKNAPAEKKAPDPSTLKNTRKKPSNATPSTKGSKSVHAIAKTKKTKTSKTTKSTKKK